jgi:hypothetical protein
VYKANGTDGTVSVLSDAHDPMAVLFVSSSLLLYYQANTNDLIRQAIIYAIQTVLADSVLVR